MTEDQARRDLEDLLNHPGWQRVVQVELAWWQESLGAQLAACANDGDDVRALNKMRQLVAAKQAVERFIARPKELLRGTVEAERVRPTTMARGGV